MAISDTQAAINALKSGEFNKLGEISGDPSSTDSGDSMYDTEESEDVLSMFDNIGDDSEADDQSEEESTSGEESGEDTDVLEALDEEGSKEEPAPELPATEVIKADGKRIKIDYNDRTAIKRAFAAQAGMRKFQRERDEAFKDRDAYKSKAEVQDKLDHLYQTQGFEGVVEQLTGKPFDEIVQERIDRLILREEKPDEAARLDYEDKLAAERREREAMQAQLEQYKSTAEADREAAEEARLEGLINPVFQRYSFAGKFGDEVAEHQMDKALWDQALARLEEYEEHQITPAVIRKEFRTVANRFGKIVSRQADRKVKEVSTQRKRSAKEHVQAQVAEGTVASGSKAAWAKKFKSGDLTGSLTDILKGKVKL